VSVDLTRGSGDVQGPAPAEVPEAPRGGRGRRIARIATWGVALPLLLTRPWWGRAGLRHLDFFHVRAVEVVGTRYLDPAVVAQRLAVDTLHSVWDEIAPLEQRVAGHPQVASVAIERRLPGTLLVRIEERAPVAFTTGERGLRVLDADGRELPIDPSRTPVDLPVLAAADTALLRLLGELQATRPGLYRRVSEVRPVGRDELVFRLFSTSVRTARGVSAARLAEVEPVEADLARRQLRPAELDLRFRDQVIARLQ
jgi:cell division protein FtsQ